MFSSPSLLRHPKVLPSSPRRTSCLQSGSPNDPQFHIQLSDLQRVLDQLKVSDNPTIQKYCQDRAAFKMEHIIKRINAGMPEIRSRWPDATALELYLAFEMCQESLEDLLESIEAQGFRDRIRDAATRNPDAIDARPNEPAHPPDEEDDEKESDDDEDFVAECSPSPSPTPHVRCPKAAPGTSTSSLPCPEGVSAAVWARWSDARRTSYYQVSEHPNAYYYRHLPAGEVQRRGPWTPHEKQLFLERMQELRGDSDTFGHDWGMFSLTIPGRVGYQCSNFYRALLLAGELHDSRYMLGADGRLHHTSRIQDGQVKTYRKGKNRTEPAPSIAVRTFAIEDILSLKFLRSQSMRETDEQPEDERGKSRYELWALQNPIPEAVDFITGEVMRVPAMSPDGYVLDYKTWLESLAEKPVNPFTQCHLTKRQLVILTTENYHQYAEKIVNLRDN